MQILKKTYSSDTLMNENWLKSAGLDHFWMMWRFKFLLKQLSKIKIKLKKNYKIMDLGCGNGVLSNQLERHNLLKIDRVDSNYETLKLNKNVKGKLICYNISKKDNKMKRKYDIIFLFDVLEHVKNDNKFINDINFHLKKNGYLIVNVPSINLLFSKYDYAVGHLRRYNKQNLSKNFDNKLFKICSLEYWGFCLVPILFIRKLISMFYSKKKTSNIVKLGWKTNTLINNLFKIVMNIETLLLNYVPIGSSLMLIVKKK